MAFADSCVLLVLSNFCIRNVHLHVPARTFGNLYVQLRYDGDMVLTFGREARNTEHERSRLDQWTLCRTDVRSSWSTVTKDVNFAAFDRRTLLVQGFWSSNKIAYIGMFAIVVVV